MKYYFTYLVRIREPLKTKKYEADKPEKAELPIGNEHFEGEVQRSNSKFLEVSVNYFSAVIIFLICCENVFSQTTINFNYTGSAQTWTVPACVNTITVTLEGAQGGGNNGGMGATVIGTLTVTPGQVLQINVGGLGTAPGAGWNGGGAGQNASASGCASGPANTSFGGGGASDIRIVPYALADRQIVASGGGGTGGGDTDGLGGTGGCNSGTSGASPFGQGGFGATQTAGGAGGPPWIASGNPGQPGVLGVGGNGATDPCYNVGPAGGGGGGFYGGGGGGSDCFSGCPLGGGGGGGGSSLVPAAGSCTAGNNTGNGQVTITLGAGSLSSSISSSNPSCNGGTGSASVTIVGGTSPFTYSWNPSVSSSSSATGLSAGNYSITVTDATNCSSTLTFTITQPPVLTLSVVNTTTVVCGANNGTATVSGSGGTGALTYLWNTTPPQSGVTASNLATGNYIVTLTDANGCTTTQSVTITGSGAYSVTPTQTNILCFGNNNGSATVTTNGGSAPFTYSWSTTPVQTTPTISNIPAGNYTCTITDASGCTQTATYTITQPPALTGSISSSVNVSCFGGNNGNATAGGNGGTGTINYSWNTTPAQTGATVTNLIAGNYVVTITDANGCSLTQSVTITEPTGMAMSTTSTPSDCGVQNGTASVISSGGVTPYTYLWLTTPVQVTSSVTGLSGGNYTIIVADANGCTQSQNVLVPVVSPPVANFSFSSDVVSLLDPLVIFLDGSTGNPTLWSWNFGDPNSGVNDSSFMQNPNHTYSDTGVYCITLAIADPTGVCNDIIIKCLTVEAPFTFFLPNSFTPNGDGLNELFIGYGSYIKEFEILIFDRWGNEVFKSTDLNKGWNGKVKNKGDMVQEDVYLWKVFIKDFNNKKHIFTGRVTLVK